jgi:predicted flap endonuclease-1-like 5' DNA nuclease
MAITRGAILVMLGVITGFIVSWSYQAGISVTLFTGLLLTAAGAILGFVSEWIIDEAHRRNRELTRQLNERSAPPVLALQQPHHDGGTNGHSVLSENWNNLLRVRDQEVNNLREQLSSRLLEAEALRTEFEVYQRGHPDNLTVIKGIGPIYQWKLRDIGIHTLQQLAQADAEQLRRKLDIKKWQRANVESWIEQARDWAHEVSLVRPQPA